MLPGCGRKTGLGNRSPNQNRSDDHLRIIGLGDKALPAVRST